MGWKKNVLVKYVFPVHVTMQHRLCAGWYAEIAHCFLKSFFFEMVSSTDARAD